MGDKRTPLPFEPDKRAETASSREAGSRPASEAIPKAVANRMARRVAVFTGSYWPAWEFLLEAMC